MVLEGDLSTEDTNDMLPLNTIPTDLNVMEELIALHTHTHARTHLHTHAD